jgi:hypothetical protein
LIVFQLVSAKINGFILSVHLIKCKKYISVQA